MRIMVKHYLDSKGRLSFRHTIERESDRFKVIADEKLRRLVVRPRKGDGPAPYWSYEDLIAAAGAKLRRLMLVNGEVEKRRVRFLYAEEPMRRFHLADFIQEVLRGSIAIDFDCRESKPGSVGLRNHAPNAASWRLAI